MKRATEFEMATHEHGESDIDTEDIRHRIAVALNLHVRPGGEALLGVQHRVLDVKPRRDRGGSRGLVGRRAKSTGLKSPQDIPMNHFCIEAEHLPLLFVSPSAHSRSLQPRARIPDPLLQPSPPSRGSDQRTTPPSLERREWHGGQTLT